MNILNPHIPQQTLIFKYLKLLSSYYAACYEVFPNRNQHCLNRELELANEYARYALHDTEYNEAVRDIIKNKIYLRTDRIKNLLNIVKDVDKRERHKLECSY